jgi:lipopolysaccharide/colanic/teichoic acid biosynthesis glycosyltransferase
MPAPRRPHHLSLREIARIGAEHVLGVSLLLLGLVAGAFLRDDRLPSLVDIPAWTSSLGAIELAAFALRLQRFRPMLPDFIPWFVLATAVLQYSMYLHGLYDRRAVRRARNEFFRFVRSAAVAGLFISVIFFFVRPPELGRTALVIGYALTILVAWGGRTLARGALATRPERLLLLGSGPACLDAARAAAGVGSHVVLGRLGEPNIGGRADHGSGDGDVTLVRGQDMPRLGGWEDLGRVLETLASEQASRSPGSATPPVDRLLLASAPPPGWNLEPIVSARLSGAMVASAREFAEGLTGEVLEEDPGVEFLTDATSRAYGRVSRLADVVLAACGLALSLPLLFLSSLGILVTSGRPILFSQERIGFGGRPYRCWKLRTMRRDAEAGGPAWSSEQDPRIEPFGRFLRRWRIDEIPQLVNVLRGDMAFVGPRPEQPLFVARLAKRLPYYYLRHVVRPGLTGWAQVRAPYGSTEDDARKKLRFDLFYIKHRSPYLDVAILFDTVRVVLLGKGR